MCIRDRSWELYVCSNCRRAFLISSAGTGKSFAHKRAGKTADAVEACSYSYLYEIDIRTLNLCFPIRIFRPQLSVALMRLDKGEKFVVEPEGINEYGIYLANPFLGCPAVERSAAADNLPVSYTHLDVYKRQE